MAKIKLTLKHMSAFFDEKEVFVGKNESLQIELKSNNQTRGRVVLYFNGKPYVFYKNVVEIPQSNLLAINTVLVQDKTAGGSVLKEWRNNEKLCLNLERLDADGEKQFVAEREQYKQMQENFAKMAKEFKDLQTVHSSDRKHMEELIKKLATEVVRQGNVIAEMTKDIEAIKNDPVV